MTLSILNHSYSVFYTIYRIDYRSTSLDIRVNRQKRNGLNIFISQIDTYKLNNYKNYK